MIIDHFDGREIIRPVPNARLTYDFDFRKKGSDVWRYLNSHDDLKAFADQIATTLQNGGEYQIVNARTGEVICQSRSR